MIIAAVRRTLAERELVDPGDHVLVACSGGPDSIALLHVLSHLRTKARITLCCGSVDHGLRPEAAEEVKRVGAFANSLGVPFRAARIEVPREGASLQGRARELRYVALADMAQELQANRIAVGHTQEDQAESVLGRLLRGAGVRGLAGIEARRADGVIRPLIDCSRAAVRAYAEAEALPFIDDPSNEDLSFERVRIRQHILPQLLQENPQLVAHLGALADEAADLNAYLDERLPGLVADGARAVSVQALASLASPLRAPWLRRWVQRETAVIPGRTHLRDVLRLLRGRGEVLLPSGWSVRREDGDLLLQYREHRTTRTLRNEP